METFGTLFVCGPVFRYFEFLMTSLFSRFMGILYVHNVTEEYIKL